jgi:WD40 repeat protein
VDFSGLRDLLKALTRSGVETGPPPEAGYWSWLSRCAAAVRSGNLREADALTSLLDKGQDVAAALGTEPYWPGARGEVDGRGGARTSAARAVLSVAYAALDPAREQVWLDAAAAHWQQAYLLPEEEAVGDFATLVRRMLCGDLPDPVRPVHAAVVFGGRPGGFAATLTLAIQPTGPRGLFPDPRSMTFLAADDEFAAFLAVAWHSAPALRERCVIWDISDKEQPFRSLPTTTGGSLGAAFGVALHDLARANRPLGGTRIRRLDPACAVTGELFYSGTLGRVGQYEQKFSAAADRKLRVVAPDDPDARKHRGIPRHADFVRDLPAAIRKSHLLRPWPHGIIALTVLLVAAASVSTGVALAAQSGEHAANVQAARQRAAELSSKNAALSGRLDSLADANIGTNLAVAQLLAAEATRLDNTPQARAALFQAATANPSMERIFQAGSDVTALAVAADGNAVAAGTSDGDLIRFDLATGTSTETAYGSVPIQGVAISGNGGTVAAANGVGAVAWIPGHAPTSLPVRGDAFSVALSPSGGMEAVLSTQPGTGTGTDLMELLTVLNLQRGTQVSTAPITHDRAGQVLMPPTPAQLSGGGYTELAFPSESTLTVTYNPGTFVDYAPSSLQATASGSQIAAAVTGQVAGNSANGAFYGAYYSAGSSISDGPEGKAPTARSGRGPAAEPTEVTFSDDGTLAASVGGGIISVSPLSRSSSAPGSQHQDVQLTANSDTSVVAFAGDDQLVSVSGSTLQLWDLNGSLGVGLGTGLHLAGAQVQEGGDPLAVSPDGQFLAIGDVNNPTLTLTPEGEDTRLWMIRNDPAFTTRAQGPLRGQLIWSGDRLLELSEGDSRVQLTTTSGAVVGSWLVPVTSTETGLVARVLTDGQIMIITGDTAIMVNPRTGQSTDRAIPSGALSVTDSELSPEAISQDGTAAVFLDSSGSDSLVYMNLTTGAARIIDSGQPRFVQFAGDHLFILLFSGIEQEWDATAGHVRTLPTSGPETFGVSLSPDGTLLAQVSNNGTVSVTDTASGDIIASFSLPASKGAAPDPWAVTTTSFTPGDRYLFTGTPGGELIRWDIGEPDLIALACYRAGARLTPAIWEQYVQTTPPADLACSGPVSRTISATG